MKYERKIAGEMKYRLRVYEILVLLPPETYTGNVCVCVCVCVCLCKCVCVCVCVSKVHVEHTHESDEDSLGVLTEGSSGGRGLHEEQSFPVLEVRIRVIASL